MKLSEERKKEIIQFVLDKRDEGRVVVLGIEGPMSMPLDSIIQQPAEGTLYDLNRLGETVLTFIDDPKWVNDFAVGLVIEKLKSKLDQLEAELEIEKQKHLDTSNWAEEQQGRADKAEAENERITNLQDRIFEWGRKTFGPGQRSGGVFAHLAREIKELGESLPEIDPDELADCTILLFELAGFANVQLLDEVEKKFEINQAREWGPIEANGSILHIESGGE